MTMARRNKLKNVRPKALLGEAILGGGATMAAAAMQAIATKNAADTQAKAIQEQAKLQQDALVRVNDNNNALQEKSIEFTKQQNELNRNLQKEMQMNLQLLAGQQNNNQLREASRIQVKCGGSSRRKLRNAGVVPASFLQGMNNNLPFTVTDGGSVQHLATTPEGYDLYEIYGNDHEHYHKTRNGKSKTGVGIRFAGSKTIEGEGNQNTNNGELMLVTPNDAKFISKHSIKGYNPRTAVMSGEHPMVAFARQEAIKNAYGIDDDGTKSPVGRRKALTGMKIWNPGSWFSEDKEERNLINGSFINAGANLIGAGITNWANNKAAETLTDSYKEAGDTLANAYNSLKTIDMSAINRDDYRAAHAMAALQAPVVNTGVERAAAERDFHRTLKNIDNNTLSGAAAQNRKAMAGVQHNDRIGQIEFNADKLTQDIIRSNMHEITHVSNENANRDAQANNAYANAYLNLLQYNNDIKNERETGAAQAKADTLAQIAGIKASTKQANASAWANGLTGSTSGINNVLNIINTQRSNRENILFGTDTSSKVQYYLNKPTAPGIDSLITVLEASGLAQHKKWADLLRTAKIPMNKNNK